MKYFFRVIGGSCSLLPGTGQGFTGFWGPLQPVLRLAVDQAYSFLENPEWSGQNLRILMTLRKNLIICDGSPYKVGHSEAYDEGEVFVVGFKNISQVVEITWEELFSILQRHASSHRQGAGTLTVNLTDRWGYNSLRLPGELWFEFSKFERLWRNHKWSRAFKRELKRRLRALSRNYRTVIVRGGAGEWEL